MSNPEYDYLFKVRCCGNVELGVPLYLLPRLASRSRPRPTEFWHIFSNHCSSS